MTTISLNGRPHALSPGATLIEAVSEITGRPLGPDGTPQDGERLGVAAAVDAVVVPRSQWHTTELEPGQAVEIITAMQGG